MLTTILAIFFGLSAFSLAAEIIESESKEEWWRNIHLIIFYMIVEPFIFLWLYVLMPIIKFIISFRITRKK